MAKYDVTMSCGHTQTIVLFGKMDARYKKIEWLEQHGLCDECYKAQQKAKHAEVTAKAAEKAVADNLPELTGTEKQVNWALAIRDKFFGEVDKKVEDNKNRMDADTLAKSELQATAIKKVMAKFTAARFWIDNRDKSLRQIIMSNDLAEIIKSEFANLMIIALTDDIATADAVDASVEAMTASEGEEITSDVDDDGSNDDPDEESVLDTVGLNFDDDEEEDDELIDEPEIKNVAAIVEENTGAKFKFGKTYNAGNIAVTIINRTEKTVVLKVERLGGMRNDHKVLAENIRKRVKINKNGSEFVTVQPADYGKVDINSESEMDYQKYLDEYTEIHQVKDVVVESEVDEGDYKNEVENEVEMVKELHRQLVAGDEAAKELLADGTIKPEIVKYNFEEGVDGGAALNFGEWDCYDVVGLKAAYRIIKRAGLNRGEYILQDDRAFHNITVYRPAIIKMCKTYGVEYKGIKSANEYDAMVETATIVEESKVEEVQEVAETPQVEVNTLSIAELDAIHCQLFCAGANETCSILKGDDTASLQAELDNAENEIEMCRQDVDESERLLAHFRRMYLETIAKLAKIEDKITEYGLILHENKKALTDVETCAAAIQAQIDSQKYSAQKLLDAVNSVDNTVSVDTITFELQKFTCDEAEERIEELETKFRADERDTSTELTPANTFTGLVDTKVDEVGLDESPEDREFDRLKSKLITDIHDLEIEIEILQKRINELSKMKLNTLIKLSKKVLELQKFISHNVRIKKNVKIDVISSIDSKSYVLDEESRIDGVELKAEISTYNGLIEVYIDINGDEMVSLATYQSVTDFRAAIKGLAAAIKRGDAKYKFPPDKSGIGKPKKPLSDFTDSDFSF